MSRTLQEARIAGRGERKRLAPGVHWRGIDPEVHLGYRKGKRGGSWLVRWRDGKGYRQRVLGTADDELCEGTLDFYLATRSARELVERARGEARARADGPELTVRQAVLSYVAARDARESKRKGRTARSDAASRLTRYVSGRGRVGNRKQIAEAALAAIPLHNLNESDLIEWRLALPDGLKGTTKQRLVNDLKSALNGAYLLNRKRLPPTFPATIKHGLASLIKEDDDGTNVARENQILPDSQIIALIEAAREIDADRRWEGDLFRLVVILAATGARFSQVARLRVGDVQAEAKRIMMPVSRKGHGGKAGRTPVPVGPDVLTALQPAVKGRRNDAVLLERHRSQRIAGGIQWHRVGRGPWQSASELNRLWKAVCERAGLPTVIPYALRHSSIVRGIRANLPIRLVAALHDTSVAMIERHYGRFIADGLDELAARAIVPLVLAAGDSGKVVRLTGRKAP